MIHKLKTLLAEAQLNRIAKNTDATRRRKSTSIGSKLSTVMKYNTAKGTRFHFKLKTESQSGRGPYNVDFRTPIQYTITEDNWKTLRKGGVSMLANCDCADFKYRWETVLHDNNSARRLTSNGESPDVRNPSHKLSFCKHILSAWPVVRRYISKRDFNQIGARR